MKKFFPLSLSILLFSATAFAQSDANTVRKNGYVFPENSSEFQVTFPASPKIEKVFAPGGASGLKALLGTSDFALKAELLPIPQEVATAIPSWSDEFLASAALNHANDNAYEGATVSTGKNVFGRYAKMQGYKSIQGVRHRIEITFLYGKKQILVLQVFSPSATFPTKEMTEFRNSLSLVR